MDSINDTTENLERSIQMFNQENAQRKSFLRLSGKSITPKRLSLQNTNHLRKDQDDSYQFNDINSPKMLGKFYPHSRLIKGHDLLDIDNSLTLTPHEVRDIMAASEKGELTLREMMEDSSATGIILKSKKPLRDVMSKLYYDFLHSVQINFSETQVFDTIADFIQNCTDTLDIMRGMQSKVETNVSDEEISLENERNTWRLIYCLYQNRINSLNFPTPMEDDLEESNTYISEKVVIDNLFKTESYIREYQLIIDWLEKNALDQAEKHPITEHFTDKTLPWENTVRQLLTYESKDQIPFRSTRPLLSSLDPDAPIRESGEGKSLHDLDKEDDKRLEKRMFIEVRCGRLQKAQALAEHCGQPWKAACLLGWIPHHDPNYQNPLIDTKLPIEGNPNRSLWKLCAWELSQDKRVGEYYRTIYASLCGNLQQMLQIATSWQDALWAYMKTLLDIKVEREVRDLVIKSFTNMPDDYWKNEISLKDVFKELHASKDPKIRMESNKPDHLIQKYLILDQIPKLMEEIDNMINTGTCDPHFLRFLAHLICFFRQIGKNAKDKIGDKVLLAYVHILIEMDDPILIAFYTAMLPRELQVTNYASYLENIKDHEQRRKCLTAAEDANLNVEAITKLVVESIRSKNIDIDPIDLKGTLTDTDIDKINALDWLIFYPSQREEALWQTNALIRYFLANEKIDAARKAFNKIPVDSIEAIMAEYPTMEGTLTNLTMTSNLSKKASSTIREYVCYKTYLDAQEGFAEWFSHYHHGKPAPLEELPPYATFTEKVAYEHKKAQYNIEMERWTSTMQHHTKAVKQLLFNVLLFPDGGWLVDSNNNNNDEPCTPEEISRDHQMEKLRELCIPKITLLLHSVMSEMNEHAECIQLADILASEQYQLYKVFQKGRLREVFKKICESSLVLMDQKKDPWGYPK
ncbi:nuclear pore complex protein [Apis mellifera caucasica]|uniref:Nuclear pore complex protein n=1 Tax=Apis mellifera TaxID=7460 RepID=A0A7M7R706_APIME|nr:nuclear pore complex protein Nup107 [Apis mellifera]KAG6797251.1 nuclear pore complex protein [Apis mellifera caucasica]|eukprot:XP_397116.4 nuclear pore complex protein Nup107 [Apis mellifera]